MKHIEFENLLEKFEGRLTPEQEHPVTAHLEACPECEAEAGKLAIFFEYLALRAGIPVPQAVTAHILNIYQRRPIPAEPVAAESSGLGYLIFDDWAMALNERYSGLDTRQLLYRIKGFDIDLRIELIGDNCRLAGQLFPEIVGAVANISSAEHKSAVDLNELGEFVFDIVPQGIYTLTITAGPEDLRVENVPLQR